MFRCYRQLEHSDCGLTCIRMIARHYGKKIPIKYLQGLCDINRLGMSIRDIVGCCDSIGLDAEAVRIDTDQIREMPLPAILYWRQRHFVVLYRIRKGRYYVADPSKGKSVYDGAAFADGWIPEGDTKGLAIMAAPTRDFHDREYGRSRTLAEMFSYMFASTAGHRWKLTWVLAISVLLMGADLAVPLLLRRTVDEGIGLRDLGLVFALLLSQFALIMGYLVSSSGMNLLLANMGLRINTDMVDNFLTRLTAFPMAFFDRKVSSDFVQKITDQSRIKDFLLSFPNTILVTLLNLIVFSALLVHYSGLVFVLFVVMSLLEIGWNAMFLSRRKSLDYSYFVHSSDNRNHAYELVNGMAELKVNNAEGVRVAKWRDTQEKLNDTSMKTERLNVAQGGGATVLSRLKDLGITGISAYMVINGDMTLGIMMTLGYITGRLSQPFNTLSTTIQSLQNAHLSYQRIDEVLHDDGVKGGEAKYTCPEIVFENVWFKYPGSGSPFVIQDFSLKVKEGKVTALVGESGCGKSTLIKLMLGFYIPQKGTLRLGESRVGDTDTADWMRHCGVVMQEGHIFTGSILENISLSEKEPDREKALGALETAGLLDFVKKLPMGVYTRIGVSGIELSGGQKQRLMIARALYKSPDILFLDEATSSLDANNERNIVDNIRRFSRGRTMIVAAHRLSTVKDADLIVYIADGRIEESGTHDELVKKRGKYWQLVRNQLQLSV